MKTFTANPDKPIILGKKGENNSVRWQFPVVKKWTELYGLGGTFSLVHQRATDEAAYPCSITWDDETVTWEITSSDTNVPGLGKAELIYTLDSVVAKSVTFDTKALDTLNPSAEPPEPWESWIQEVIDAKDDAEDAASTAIRAAEAAEAAEQHIESAISAHNTSADAHQALFSGKADKDDTYTKTEVDNKLATKSNINHNHDSRYYKQEEIDETFSYYRTSAEQDLIDNTFATSSELSSESIARSNADTTLSGRLDTIEGKEAGWDAKQNAISDLSTIRSGAFAGATALQDAPTDGKQYARQSGAWAEVDAITSVDWTDVNNKPSTFPPSTHNHDDAYYGKSTVDGMIAGKLNNFPVITLDSSQIDFWTGTVTLTPEQAALVEDSNNYGFRITSTSLAYDMVTYKTYFFTEEIGGVQYNGITFASSNIFEPGHGHAGEPYIGVVRYHYYDQTLNIEETFVAEQNHTHGAEDVSYDATETYSSGTVGYELQHGSGGSGGGFIVSTSNPYSDPSNRDKLWIDPSDTVAEIVVPDNFGSVEFPTQQGGE